MRKNIFRFVFFGYGVFVVFYFLLVWQMPVALAETSSDRDNDTPGGSGNAPVRNYVAEVAIPIDDWLKRIIRIYPEIGINAAGEVGAKNILRFVHTPLFTLVNKMTVEIPTLPSVAAKRQVDEQTIYTIYVRSSSPLLRELVRFTLLKQILPPLSSEITPDKIIIDRLLIDQVSVLAVKKFAESNVLAIGHSPILTSYGDVFPISLTTNSTGQAEAFEAALQNNDVEFKFSYSFQSRAAIRAKQEQVISQQFFYKLRKMLEARNFLNAPIFQTQLAEIESDIKSNVQEYIWSEEGVDFPGWFISDTTKIVDRFFTSKNQAIDTLDKNDLGLRVQKYLEPIVNEFKSGGAANISNEQFEEIKNTGETVTADNQKLNLGLTIPIVGIKLGFDATTGDKHTRHKETIDRLTRKYGLDVNWSNTQHIIVAKTIAVHYFSDVALTEITRLAKQLVLFKQISQDNIKESPIPVTFQDEEITPIIEELKEKARPPEFAFKGCVITSIRFNSNSQGCQDKDTGLIWSDPSPYQRGKKAASDFCVNLRQGGLDRWRLPTRSEFFRVRGLNGIIEYVGLKTSMMTWTVDGAISVGDGSPYEIDDSNTLPFLCVHD